MERTKQINEFAEILKEFFIVFDGYFLHEENAEELLCEARESLKEKVLHNESALPVIIALGGNYDSGIDSAKVEEITALLGLIKARKHLRDVMIQSNARKDRNTELLAQIFGI